MVNYKIHYTGEEIDELLDTVNGNGTKKAIITAEQTLSNEEKAQARTNIGAVDENRIHETDENVIRTQELIATVEENAGASKSYAIGEYLIYQTKLYKAIAAISAGDLLEVGTNIEETTLGSELNALEDSGNSRVDAAENGIVATREDTSTASRNYAIGEYLVKDDKFYKVIAAINNGGTITVGTNVEEVDIGSELKRLEDRKANIDGTYKDLVSGGAQQLLSDLETIDKAPYNFRTAGGSLEIGDKVKEKKIIGGTVAWNQLAKADASAWNRIRTTLTVSGTKFTMTLSGTSGQSKYIRTDYLLNNHKYLFLGRYIKSESTVGVSYGLYDGKPVSVDSTYISYADAYDGKPMDHFFSAPPDGSVRFTLLSGSSVADDVIVFDKPMLFDLTQMFGTTIADYVYSLETSTPGAGVAWFRNLFPASYYAYDTGTLRSVNVLTKKSTGFNQFNPSTGTAQLLGGNQYQITGTYTALAYSSGETITPDSDGYFTPEVNGVLTVTGGNNTNTCVHLVWDGEKDGEWEEFTEDSYALNSGGELRGIPKLNTNNELYWDGDRYAPDGTVTRRAKQITLNGTEDGWSRQTTSSGETRTYFRLKIEDYGDIIAGQLISTTLPKASISSSTTDVGVGVTNSSANNAAQVMVRPPDVASITSVSAFQSWLSSNPITLVYLLSDAAATTESASPYPETQNVSNWGTESFIDAGVAAGNRDVAIPVGHESAYLPDLRAKVEVAPDAPAADGTYLMKREDGQNAYVAYTGDGDLVDAKAEINGRIDDVEELITSREDEFVATKNYSVGDLVIIEDTLYEVTSAIANEETIVVGTNVMATDIETQLDKKADKNGTIANAINSENADQLVSTVQVTDNAPYIFRTTGGSADVGDRAFLDRIVGGTVAWNQQIQNGNFLSKNNWTLNGSGITWDVADSVAEIAYTVSETQAIRYIVQSVSYIAGHKYLFSFDCKASEEKPIRAYAGQAGAVTPIWEVEAGTTWITCGKVQSALESGVSDWKIGNKAGSGGTTSAWTLYLRNVMIIDLTQMFGTTIADYVASLETSTPGAGVAWFRAMFPAPYYAYDAGTLRSVQAAAKKTVGFNAYNGTTGTAALLGGHEYQITGTYTALTYSTGETITPDASGCFTPTENGTLTVTGGASDTCVHLTWSGYRNGEYAPYTERTYALDDSLTLMGLPKLDAANALYYDGDGYAPDGTVTRRYDIKNLGELTWSYSTPAGVSYKVFYTSAYMDTSAAYLTTKYPYMNGGRTGVANGFSCSYSGRFCFRDDSLSTGDDAKAAMNGVYALYRKPEATTESAEPYQQAETVDDFGTERFVDAAVAAGTRDVAIPVGHVTRYPANLRDKLQHLPDLADEDGTYVIEQDGAQMTLTPLVIPDELPDDPGEDGTYTLKCTVSDGVVTKTWVADT